MKRHFWVEYRKPLLAAEWNTIILHPAPRVGQAEHGAPGSPSSNEGHGSRPAPHRLAGPQSALRGSRPPTWSRPQPGPPQPRLPKEEITAVRTASYSKMATQARERRPRLRGQGRGLRAACWGGRGHGGVVRREREGAGGLGRRQSNCCCAPGQQEWEGKCGVGVTRRSGRECDWA